MYSYKLEDFSFSFYGAICELTATLIITGPRGGIQRGAIHHRFAPDQMRKIRDAMSAWLDGLELKAMNEAKQKAKVLVADLIDCQQLELTEEATLIRQQLDETLKRWPEQDRLRIIEDLTTTAKEERRTGLKCKWK